MFNTYSVAVHYIWYWLFCATYSSHCIVQYACTDALEVKLVQCCNVSWCHHLVVLFCSRDDHASSTRSHHANEFCLLQNLCWSKLKFGTTYPERMTSMLTSDASATIHETCHEVWMSWCRQLDTTTQVRLYGINTGTWRSPIELTSVLMQVGSFPQWMQSLDVV